MLGGRHSRESGNLGGGDHATLSTCWPRCHVIADLIRNPEVKGGQNATQSTYSIPSFPASHTVIPTPSRHTGLDPVSTARGHATLSTCWLRHDAHVIADLIRNPEGHMLGGRHSQHHSPSFPRKRESIKRCVASSQSCKSYPGPSFPRRRESTGRGENKTTPNPYLSIPIVSPPPSFPRKRESNPPKPLQS